MCPVGLFASEQTVPAREPAAPPPAVDTAVLHDDTTDAASCAEISAWPDALAMAIDAPTFELSSIPVASSCGYRWSGDRSGDLAALHALGAAIAHVARAQLIAVASAFGSSGHIGRYADGNLAIYEQGAWTLYAADPAKEAVEIPSPQAADAAAAVVAKLIEWEHS